MIIPFISSFHVVVGDMLVPTYFIYVPFDITVLRRATWLSAWLPSHSPKHEY